MYKYQWIWYMYTHTHIHEHVPMVIHTCAHKRHENIYVWDILHLILLTPIKLIMHMYTQMHTHIHAHTHAYAYTHVHTHTHTRSIIRDLTTHIHISWTQGNHPQKFTNTGYYRIITHVFQHPFIQHTIISSISYRYHGNKPYSTRTDTVGTKNCYNAVAITNALDTTMALKNITPSCKAEACHNVTPKARVTVHMELQCE